MVFFYIKISAKWLLTIIGCLVSNLCLPSPAHADKDRGNFLVSPPTLSNQDILHK